MKTLLFSCFAMLWAGSAIAHSPLETTSPAAGSTVSTAPTEVLMDFKGGIRLTKVTVTHAGTDSVDLDLSAFKGFISDYAIPIAGFGPGHYQIDWRGLGDDGHAMKGTFSFTVEE
ncbi:MAG: copper resistance protein CopC [Rhodobacteraceae bacterium]|nr:copper resistance protein CopC [Paracoccaceae bacterium]